MLSESPGVISSIEAPDRQLEPDDARRTALYVDGSVVGANNGCVKVLEWTSIVVGGGWHEGDEGVHATIAEVAIYGIDLTPTQILAHYQAGH